MMNKKMSACQRKTSKLDLPLVLRSPASASMTTLSSIEMRPTQENSSWNRTLVAVTSSECDRNDISELSSVQFSNFYTSFCESISGDNDALTKQKRLSSSVILLTW
jgi:hypothetical protein